MHEPDGPTSIATSSSGQTVSLLRSTDPTLPLPTLEELVMGYPSASRPGNAAGVGEAA